MRTRHYLSLLALLIILLALALRNHLYNLFEVARTYATFHSYIQNHQDVLFRYPANTTATTATTTIISSSQEPTSSAPLPKIIHQIYLSRGRPNSKLTKHGPAIESCKTLHPSWELKIWEDSAGEEFIKSHYPEILPHYQGYAQNIQRANILRYAVLHHFGGVYLDLDVTCLVPLDAPLLAGDGGVGSLTDLPWITPGAYPAGVNNAFILSRPGHSFLAELLARVPERDLKWPMPYVENMLSTGCMYFSNVWTGYTREIGARKGDVEFEERLFVLADGEGGMESHMLRGKVRTPIFEHGGASSWHGWDAEVIVLIGRHYGYFAMGLGVVIGVGILGCWKVCCGVRNRTRRRRSWTILGRRSLERRSIEKDEERGGLMKDG